MKHRMRGWAFVLVGPLFTLGFAAGSSASSFYSDFQTVTSVAENACLATTLSGNGDDCSYNRSNPGASQWIGPTFSAGYYASGAGPTQYADATIAPPVTTPGPILPLSGKSGIPVTGAIQIDDSGTPADPADDLIGGSLTLGPFDRNVGLGDGTRALEHFTRIDVKILSKMVSSATPNAGGGFDYVIGFGPPVPLVGSTTANGGFADGFPSEVASQSTSDPTDVGYWTAPGALGIASFEGNVGTSTQPATVVGYTCRTSVGAGEILCVDGPGLWATTAGAAFENVLIRVSTDATGVVTSASIVLVNEFKLPSSASANNSWQALTLDIGLAALRPTAIDDAFPLNGSSPVTVDVLANDLNLSNAPLTVVEVAGPLRGSITINADNTVTYAPNSGTVSDTFQYTIVNAAGFSSGSALVRVGNDVPVAHDDLASLRNAQFSQTYNRAVIVVNYKANDTGLGDTPITPAIVGPQPTHGTAFVDQATNDVVYGFAETSPGSATPGIFPIDRFMYSITDANGDSSTATVTVRGLSASRDGDRTTDKIDTVSGIAKTINILANDYGRTDSPVVVEISGPPFHGTVVINNDNTVTYTSDPKFRGAFVANPLTGQLICLSQTQCGDQFQYTIRNVEGDISSATVNINVYPPPTIKNGSAVDPWSLGGVIAFGAFRRRSRRYSERAA